MTRKCVMCKETNYKNSYSFFSAPKDPETRKKWQAAIGIDNYVVNDETFVCSRHFTPGDIITHWVSGVPPHVVTIKYKKCRLRPGAVPSVGLDMPLPHIKTEEEFSVFELNRSWGPEDKLESYADEQEQVFIIPRGDLITYSHFENQKPRDGPEVVYITQPMENIEESGEEHGEMIVLSNDSQEEIDTLQVEDEENSTIYLKADNEPQIVYVENIDYDEENRVDSRNDDKMVDDEDSNEENDHIDHVELLENDDSNDSEEINVQESLEPSKKQLKLSEDDDTIQEFNSWESTDTEKLSVTDDYDQISRPEEEIDVMQSKEEPMEETEEAEPMLFEDLLDIYTEVPLPRGWSSMVISAGRATTVIYARMNMTQTGVPYVQKQVFLKSDMNLQCSAAGTSLNPQEQNLIPRGRGLAVRTLRDVEEFIEEFDQKVVCDGLEKMLTPDVDSNVVYRQDFKWRHVDCPIIVQNSAARCTKCNTLNFHAVRRKVKKPLHPDESAALLKKERTIYVLQKMVSKLSKQNQRCEAIQQDSQSLAAVVQSLDIPDIQKLMMKECLSNAEEDAETDSSQTWIFLSLLIYIESSRVYKFLLDNQYMVLPDIQLMRRYLHHIKTDAQFYKLFQRTVEPFQTINLHKEEKEVT